jgi:hypothetical protein
LLLAVLAAASLFFALRLPWARNMLQPSPYPDAGNLTMISAYRQYDAQIPTVPVEQYQLLAARRPHQFTEFAFYRPVQTLVRTAPRQSAQMSIAVASANLFQLLQIRIPAAAPDSLILSDRAWRKYFDADPHIVGRVLELAGQPAVVAAVIPASSWQLPGRMDAWLLQDPSHLAGLPSQTKGFVLGHLRASASKPQSDPRWRLSVPNDRGGCDLFECWSLARGYFLFSSLWTLLMALLILSATTPMTLGEYPVNHRSPAGAGNLRRWTFLATKIALLLVMVCCGSLDLASILSVGFYPTAWLLGLILGLRWALIDQRQRCPVCLRLLSHPTRIGGASQTFLEWYGTELMCTHGHGLLYVPEIPTSCYSTQRWQYLDPSWSSLFS